MEVKNRAGNWDFNPMPDKTSFPPGGHSDGSMQTTEEEAALNRVKEVAKRTGCNLSEEKLKFFVHKERDPNGISLKEPGAKADLGKSPAMRGMLQYFPRALLEVGRVSEQGAKKYSWRGWEKVHEGHIRYGDALVRHIILEEIEGPYDSDTGLLHSAQVAWNALARLELILKERENDNTIKTTK